MNQLRKNKKKIEAIYAKVENLKIIDTHVDRLQDDAINVNKEK